MVDARSYKDFFERVTGNPPYPYQERLGTEPWPDLLDIPTGLGKTAAVVVAWLWKRLNDDPDTPRRLVYCLPMRTLVEQTFEVITGWIEQTASIQKEDAGMLPRVHKLLGGDVDNDWMVEPERSAILVGTQDMLLSRALMRGYGVSMYTWPMHFGFLHFDSLWLFDEVQLMGPGIATSAQLEAFRSYLGQGETRSRSLWCSATIAKDWLGTVDFESRLPDLLTLSTDDVDVRMASDRLNASKNLSRGSAMLIGLSAGAMREFALALADEIIEAHKPGTRTIVILNTVDLAQELYKALNKSDADSVLIHSRFRPPERNAAKERMLESPGERGMIVVATQVIEAGVDVSSATLFTQLCPWSSFVQRAGRCNRYGEHESAEIRWIDIAAGESALALPYEEEELELARERLASLTSASPATLPRFTDPAPFTAVLRKRDLIDLFSTDSDLSGFHTDVSDYIRDSDDRSLLVFWREGEDWAEQPTPTQEELCPASLRAFNDKKRKGKRHFVFDPNAANGSGAWRRALPHEVRPGATIMLDAKEGGYSTRVGFDPSLKPPVEVLATTAEPPEGVGDDRSSRRNYWMELADHLEHTRRRAVELVGDLDLRGKPAMAIEEAALWHDVGKLHEVFQFDLLSHLPAEDAKRDYVWAKGSWKRATDPDAEDKRRLFRRRFFRHELPGALAYLAQGQPDERELIAYLIAAHHGKVRTSLRALPTEPEPSQTPRRYGRGVWDGDELPAFSGGRVELEPMRLSLELMELGGGSDGRSWATIVEDLVDKYGPFRLALLEAVVRIADWRASGEAECWCEQEDQIVGLPDE